MKVTKLSVRGYCVYSQLFMRLICGLICPCFLLKTEKQGPERKRIKKEPTNTRKSGLPFGMGMPGYPGRVPPLRAAAGGSSHADDSGGVRKQSRCVFVMGATSRGSRAGGGPVASVASTVPAALSRCSSFKHAPQHLIRIQLNKITLINFHYFSEMNLCNLNPLLFISPPGLLIEQQGTWLYLFQYELFRFRFD